MNNTNENSKKKMEESLDSGLEESFPASDPVSVIPSRPPVVQSTMNRSAATNNRSTPRDARKYALYGGLAMILVGTLALIMPGSTYGLQALTLTSSYGLFLGLFPMNILNKLAVIIVGAIGILCAKKEYMALDASTKWSKLVCIFMTIATIAGLIQSMNTLYGYWPLFGGTILFHAVVAIISGYFGFGVSTKAMKNTNLTQKPIDRHLGV